MSTDNNTQGPIAGAIALAMLDQVEALHAATVALQELVQKDRAEGNAALRQHAAELHEILRKEAGALQLMRREIVGSAQALQALQPGIERSAELGVRKAIQEDFARPIADAVNGPMAELRHAAHEAHVAIEDIRSESKLQNWTWVAIMVLFGVALGVTGSYFFYTRDVGRINDRIDNLQQQIAPPAPVIDVMPPDGKPGKGKKGH